MDAKYLASFLIFTIITSITESPVPRPELLQGYTVAINNSDPDLAKIACHTYDKVIQARIGESGNGSAMFDLLVPLIIKLFLRCLNGVHNDNISFPNL